MTRGKSDENTKYWSLFSGFYSSKELDIVALALVRVQYVAIEAF